MPEPSDYTCMCAHAAHSELPCICQPRPSEVRDVLVYVGYDDQVYLSGPSLERFLARVAPGIPITRKAAVLALIACLHELEQTPID